ncbi:MAG TPA: MBL fold metallo-hydrolase [Chlamydiales bacterium]|jgi:phosphoribosyl 1,2-cyclic phosphodiesterase|nr:MBL fold metallo-hydrolase [Chlamydiales bacterium]
MIGFCPLASGSKGNAIFVGTKNTRILIDAGIRIKTVAERLAELDVALDSLQAILITHEHMDHIAGLAHLAERLKIPVLANAETAKGIVGALRMRPKFKIFASGETFHFGDLEIHPFTVPHDTLDPVAFTLKTGNEKLGFCADLGHVTSMIRKQLEGCDYLYVEANHEPSMVHACARPQVYKTRVLGKQGHLSNEECGQLLAHVFHAGLKHVHLAHLSSECNAEAVALRVVKEALAGKEVEISIAYQDKRSKPIYFPFR